MLPSILSGMKSSSRIIVPAIIACLLWASSFVFVKVGLRYAPPLMLAGMRFVLAGLLLLPFCGDLRKFVTAVISNLRYILVISFFTTIVHYALFFWGMTLVPGAQGAIIVGSAPLFSALLAHVLVPGDRLTVRKSLVIGLGMGGMILVALAAHPWQATGLRELSGMGILVLCEVSFVLGTITVLRSMRVAMPPIGVNCAQMSLGGVVILLLALGIEGVPHLKPQPALLGAIAAMAFISAISFSIWFHLLQSVKVSALNIWLFLIPVFGATLSWIFLPKESPDILSILGMLIIGGAIVLFYRQESVQRQNEVTNCCLPEIP